MDKELSAHPGTNQGHLQVVDGSNSQPYSGKSGRRQKKREKQSQPVELLIKTVDHFLPQLHLWMNKITDPRNAEQCIYSQAHLLWEGILMFMMHLGSRRQLRFERLDADAFDTNLAKLCRQSDLEFIADSDTLAYYARKVPLKEVDQLLGMITSRLIRMKALDPFRLYGYFTVAIDGSQVCTFDYEPWPDCPHRKLSNGSIQYFAYVLDAKLVTSCGMALTIASEMLTNEGNEEFDKQDCELKAFPRLIRKIQQMFPRTPLCLLLDGLYANQNTIRLIEEQKWKYITTFKEGSMPERFSEAVTLASLQNKNRLCITNKNITQSFQWVGQLPIAEFAPNVLFCTEEVKEKGATNFAWLTNYHVCQNNIVNIANKGGRLRWKIENEGFNVQKKDGYEMEHPYSENKNGFRVFYILLLMAHYITQLILHGNLIQSLAKSFGSAKNFARRLSESLRNYLLPDSISMPGQIRFTPP